MFAYILVMVQSGWDKLLQRKRVIFPCGIYLELIFTAGIYIFAL